MILSLFNKLRRGKHSKSIIILIILNGIGILVNFLFVPMLIGILDSEKYGIWLTISSLISWMSFFDFGLGHGLRNKLAESLAIKDYDLAKAIISTSYFSILVLVLFFIVISIFIVPILDWSSFFNSSSGLSDELQKTVFWIIFVYSFQFLFKLISSVFQSIQKPELASVVNTSGSVLSLIIVWVITYFKLKLHLWILGVILVGSPIVIMIIANIWFFTNKYSFLSPRIRNFDKKLLKGLFSLGGSFFFIQVISICLYQSNNLIIAHTSGPSSVTDFNISFKYLGVVSTIFYLIATPFWSASTEAFVKCDYNWIRNNIRKLNFVWIIFVFIFVALVFISPWFYSIWLGDKILVKYDLLVLLVVYYIFYMQWTVYGSFINGSGKLRAQLVITFVLSVLHIPLAYFLGGRFGVNGVVFSMIFIAFINIIWPRFQLSKLITPNYSGFWSR